MLIGPYIVVIDEEENQLDSTQCFIELLIGSTCFGHHYAHCQELETIPLMVGRSGAGWLARHPAPDLPIISSQGVRRLMW
jgi:hypothetical protein